MDSNAISLLSVLHWVDRGCKVPHRMSEGYSCGNYLLQRRQHLTFCHSKIEIVCASCCIKCVLHGIALERIQTQIERDTFATVNFLNFFPICRYLPDFEKTKNMSNYLGNSCRHIHAGCHAPFAIFADCGAMGPRASRGSLPPFEELFFLGKFKDFAEDQSATIQGMTAPDNCSHSTCTFC